MKHSIATVINFCTNDYAFLSECIKGVKPFSSQILIPVCDHFYDGTKENRALLSKAYAEHPDCEFIEFSYDPARPYGYPCEKKPGDLDWSRHWHSTARMISYYFLKQEIDYVLFIDVDEIYDAQKFCQWLDHFDYRSYEAMRFLSYEYFREPIYQADEWFTSGLLARKKALSPKMILNVDERLGIFNALSEPKKMYLTALDGLPMIHHYSWVRTKEQMLKKVSTWAHFWEKDWQALVEKEFSTSFQGKDFRTEAQYLTVSPYHHFSFQEETVSEINKARPTHKITFQDVFQKELESEFGVSAKLRSS